MNSLSPLVSIVVPCYQQQKLLERCLDSIELQVYKKLEVIVVDDGSEPPVFLENSKYSFTLKIIRQINSGLSSARNTGLRNATGYYIKFLDADDVLLPECISLQTRCFPEKKAISCIGFREYYEDSGEVKDIIPAFGNPLSALLLINYGPPHIYLFRTCDVNDYQGFSTEDRVNGGHEDYDLIFRMVSDGFDIITYHSIGVIYNRREGTMSTCKDKMDKSRASVWVYNVQNLLKSGDLNTNVLLSLILSFINIIKITPQKYHELFSCLDEFLSVRIEKSSLKISQEYFDYIIRFVSHSSLIEKSVSSLRKCINLENDAFFHISPQEIIDSRFVFDSRRKNIDHDYLILILAAVRKNKDHFAIYGAGEIGRQLVKILESAGFIPRYIFDKDFENISKINGLSISSPSCIKYVDLKLIVIASFAFKAEISKYIRSLNESIEVL